ncbi:hypothetical protein QJQ45_024164 [Haematococcus lacustris]|nr:hypothetical protein QJQ45_024164 [Haematococcus lacustris]
MQSDRREVRRFLRQSVRLERGLLPQLMPSSTGKVNWIGGELKEPGAQDQSSNSHTPLGPFPLTLPCPITNTSKSPTPPFPPSLSPDIEVPSLPYPAARRKPPLVPLLPTHPYLPLPLSLCCPTTTTSPQPRLLPPNPIGQPGAGSLERAAWSQR